MFTAMKIETLKLRRVLGRARWPWVFPKNSRVNPASRPL